MTNVCPVNDWLERCRVKSWKKVKIIYLRWEFNQFQFVYLSNGFILKKEILFSAVLMFSLRKRKFFHSWCTMKEVHINKKFFCANVNLLLWVLQFIRAPFPLGIKKTHSPLGSIPPTNSLPRNIPSSIETQEKNMLHYYCAEWCHCWVDQIYR